MRQQSSVIRDPVHGDIDISAEELMLLDTPEMQRLRGVRQLGTAYLVYPGAQHTRFEHSLGTMHLVSKLIGAVNRNSVLAPGELIGVSGDEERILRAAALVHDVTHIPFGHNIEDQCAILERHDSPARFQAALAPDTGVGSVLDKLGMQREVLATLLDSDMPGFPSVPPFWRQMLSDTICADILDYLLRDAHYTGLNLLYDPRVMNYFMVDRQSARLFVDLAKRGLLREDILSELVRVLDARYFFSERVYYHHAKITAGAMIAMAVEASLLSGGLEPEVLYHQTDASLVDLLEDHPPQDPEEARRHQQLIAAYRSRRLLKRACVYPLYGNEEMQDELIDRFFTPGRHDARRAFEREVESALRAKGMGSSTIALYCPARHMQLKEAQTQVRYPRSNGIQPLSAYTDRVPRLADLERSYRYLWKMYVLAATDDRTTLRAIGEIVAGMLPEATNAYRP